MQCTRAQVKGRVTRRFISAKQRALFHVAPVCAQSDMKIQNNTQLLPFRRAFFDRCPVTLYVAWQRNELLESRTTEKSINDVSFHTEKRV